MQLFSRTLTLNGSPRQVMPWATEITNHINSHSSIGVSCWSSLFGYPVGTLIWSARIESQAAFMAATADLVADGAYNDLIEQAASFSGAPAEDALRDVVYGTSAGTLPLGAVAMLTTGVAALDRMADAVAWSVDIAQHAERVGGNPVFVAIDVYGQMGRIAWLGTTADIAAADDVGAKLNADSAYLGRLAETKGLFIPGSGHRAQAVKIA